MGRGALPAATHGPTREPGQTLGADTDVPDGPPGAAQTLLERTRAAAHAGCFVCGREHPTGLRLEFHARDDGSVAARFPCGRLFAGYREALHGGVIAALLDAAMTNCLFAKGISAVTAEMTVRYLTPVKLDLPAEVIAVVTRTRGPLYHLQAELSQGSTLAARAKATFMRSDRSARGNGR